MHMSKAIKKFLIYSAVFVVIDLVLIFSITSLEKGGMINDKTSIILSSFFSVFSFFFYSYLLGHSLKKRGLLLGIFLISIYILISMIILGVSKSLDPFNITMITLKSLALVLGSIIGVNMGSKIKKLS